MLNGHIRAYSSEEDISFAQISIDDDLPSYADFEGKFNFQALAQESYRIKIEMTGYKTLIDTIELSDNNEFFDFFLLKETEAPDSGYVKSSKNNAKAGGSALTRDIRTIPGHILTSQIVVNSECVDPIRGSCASSGPHYLASALPKGRKHYRFQRKTLKKLKGRKLTREEKKDLRKFYLN